MKLKAPQIEIPPEDPFKNDLLNRKITAEQLTEILKSLDEPLVFCINADLGNGKTTFIKMWRGLLNREGFKTLYFNAWENDHSDDALVSLIGELSAGMGELKLAGQKAQKAKRYLKQAKALGATLVKKGLPAGIRIVTGGALDVSGIDLAKAGSKLSELAEEVAKEQIDQYEEAKKTLSGFKDQLKSFAEEVTAPDEGEERRPIVVLIDELDRCRPTYAVQVLEKIKHLFSVPNIIFILAIDKEQLGYSIQSMYGQGMNVSGYLRRFIDLDFNLPVPDVGEFCRAQFERFGLSEWFEKRKGETILYDRGQLSRILTAFFTGFGCTLREQEHCFTLLTLAIRATKENFKIYPLLLGTLVLLKIKNHQLYSGFTTGKIDADEVLNYIRFTATGKKFLKDNYGVMLEIELRLCQDRNTSVGALQKRYQETEKNEAIPQGERDRASEIGSMLNTYSHGLRDATGCLGYLVQKIDLVSRFDT